MHLVRMKPPEASLMMRRVPDLVYLPTDIVFILTIFLDGVATVCCHSMSKRWYQASTQDLLFRIVLVSEYSAVSTKVPSLLSNESSDFGRLVGMHSNNPYANWMETFQVPWSDLWKTRLRYQTDDPSPVHRRLDTKPRKVDPREQIEWTLSVCVH